MKKVDNFFEIYKRINDIVRAIQVGVDGYDFKVGDITPGVEGDYAFVGINYINYEEELTKYIKIPYEVLEKGNGMDKFIREQITNFDIPF